jgi:multiple sugar transport system ATP-binding protein
VAQGEGVPAKVVVVEPLGSETQVMFSIGGATVVAVIRERLGLQPDETVWIRPQVENVRLFSADDGRRIASGQ